MLFNMKNKTPAATRYLTIDVLRAIAIAGVMLTHSLAVYLGSGTINSVWNYLHFVVVAFVACSGYVSARAYLRQNKPAGLKWLLRRFVRLCLPYYIYVLAYMALAFLFPPFVKGTGIRLTPSFLISSFTFTGGADVGWLPLLFLQFAILTPLFFWLLKDKKLFFAAFVLTGLFSLITVFHPISSTYSRAIAWLPWSFIFLLGAKIAVSEHDQSLKDKTLIFVSCISFFIFLLFDRLLISWNRPLTLTLHKYPPDLFYLSYGIGTSGLILWFVRQMKLRENSIMKVVVFVSKNSYGMFFLHLIILDATTTIMHHPSVCTTVVFSILMTVGLTWIWNEVKKLPFFLFSSK